MEVIPTVLEYTSNLDDTTRLDEKIDGSVGAYWLVMAPTVYQR